MTFSCVRTALPSGRDHQCVCHNVEGKTRIFACYTDKSPSHKLSKERMKGMCTMGKKGTGLRYVLLDLGEYFAAGRVIRNTPHVITLEVVRDRGRFRPAYSRETVHQMIPIDKRR